eukprot:m.188551 g.188551  ORF g.188551 m.188551 type:complete len:623 (-) comp17477_c0_seq1:27-1895(-)
MPSPSLAKRGGSVFRNVKREVKAEQLDEYGNKVEFDVRKDEEQDVKLDETVRLLLAAGYFRARIKALSPFDKIVGGMTWCITASNEDVDVDVLFEENANIGAKIALTEKIVAALPRLKCPLRLEPHQIQGLDCIHIYPVVQWLVKKALETREELAAQQRNSALHEFDKHGCTPADQEFNSRLPSATEAVLTVQAEYCANRQLKAPSVDDADEETRVQCTLLEYGQRYGASKIPKAKKDGEKSKDGQSEEDLIAMEQKRVKAIMKKMTALDDAGVSATVLGDIASMQSKEVQEMAQTYAKEAAALQEALDGAAGGEAAHKRTVAALTKQTSNTQAKLEATQAKYDEMKEQHDEAEKALAKVQKYAKRIDAEMAKLDELEGDEANKPIIAELRRLIGLNDALKTQEKGFKASCQAEMTKLESDIERMEGSGVEIMDDERTQAIKKQYEEDVGKMNKLKLLAARRAREIANLERKIDEYPGRAELTQYQRRFVELASQVLTKLRETKQYYTFYNTLDDTKLYMAKEVKLLESVNENYTTVQASTKGKEQLIAQMTGIVESLTQNLEKMQSREAREKENRDKLKETQLSLYEKERAYYKAVKDYETECSKNEILISKLERRGRKQG